jgi:hypothetical protein
MVVFVTEKLIIRKDRARICKPFKEPRNRFLGIDFWSALNVYKYGLRVEESPSYKVEEILMAG